MPTNDATVNALIDVITKSNSANVKLSENVELLAKDINRIAITCEKHVILLDQQQEINSKLENKIDKTNELINDYMPELRDLRKRDAVKGKVWGSLITAFVVAVASIFWNFK